MENLQVLKKEGEVLLIAQVVWKIICWKVSCEQKKIIVWTLATLAV